MENKAPTPGEILEMKIKLDKDKLFCPFIYQEDYAGGTRKYIREDLVIESIEAYHKAETEKLLPSDEKWDRFAEDFENKYQEPFGTDNLFEVKKWIKKTTKG